MNELINITTMSSREIAELTGKPHNDVLKAIRNMEFAWEKVNGGKFSLVEYTDAKGEKRPMYELSKTECLYIATKFNDEARAKLVIRWEELESKKQLDFSDPDTVLMLVQNWKVERDKRLAAETKLIQQAPKVEYYDEVMRVGVYYTVTEIAKNYGMTAITLNELLWKCGVQYKEGNIWIITAKYQRNDLARVIPIIRKTKWGTNVIKALQWTETGKMFIHNLLREKGLISRQQRIF
jgi:phage regulator Rha-like protein